MGSGVKWEGQLPHIQKAGLKSTENKNKRKDLLKLCLKFFEVANGQKGAKCGDNFEPTFDMTKSVTECDLANLGISIITIFI